MVKLKDLKRFPLIYEEAIKQAERFAQRNPRNHKAMEYRKRSDHARLKYSFLWAEDYGILSRNNRSHRYWKYINDNFPNITKSYQIPPTYLYGMYEKRH